MAKERPILFNGHMVRATLNGRKTQTRRVMKVQPEEGEVLTSQFFARWTCPVGQPGDRLWVRETWYSDHCFERDYDLTSKTYVGKVLTRQECEREWRGKDDEHMYYRADVPSGRFCDAGYWAEPGTCWKPSIHMPRWASRLTLETTEVRVQRIQEISIGDLWAESFREPGGLEEFKSFWDWELNPWVWAVSFKRVNPERGA